MQGLFRDGLPTSIMLLIVLAVAAVALYRNTTRLGWIDERKILFAGPTTGKSKLVTETRKLGYHVIDTDELIFGPLNVIDDWRTARGRKKMANERLVLELLKNMATSKTLVVTNLWQESFIAGLFGPNFGKVRTPYFYRRSTRVVELMTQRGGGVVSLSTAEQWVRDAESQAPKVFAYIRGLQDAEFLSNIGIKPTNQGWVIPDYNGSTKNLTADPEFRA
jgi:hypothetical protein